MQAQSMLGDAEIVAAGRQGDAMIFEHEDNMMLQEPRRGANNRPAAASQGITGIHNTNNKRSLKQQHS